MIGLISGWFVARLLLTCPSRGRPELIKTMIESYEMTKSNDSDLCIYLDNDDPNLIYYIENIDKKYYIVGDRMPVAQIHNHIIDIHPAYQYYMPINDDIKFLNNGWDIMLINAINERGGGWGIAFGRDTDGVEFYPQFPTFSVVSRNIINTIGYVYPRELKMMFGDTFLLDIGRAIGKLFYVPDIVIQHKQPVHLDTYEVKSKDFYNSERDAYAKYIDNKLEDDVNKLLEAISLQGVLRE